MMRSIIRSAELSEMEIRVEYPEGIGVTKGIRELKYDVDYKHLKGTTKEVLLNGIWIVHRDVYLSGELCMEIDHNFPFLKMHFEMEGHSSYAPGNKGSLPTDILNGTHQLFFFPEVRGKLWYPPGHRYTLEIILSLDYLHRIFDEGLATLQHFGHGINTLQPVHFASRPLPVAPAMKQVIHDFLSCPFQGAFRKVYLEAKIMELLSLQIAQLSQEPPACPCLRNRADIDKLHYVREFLTTHPDTDLSLHQLSEMAGLNDFKLKNGFKQLFRTTVFGYLTDVRMEMAKNQIRDTQFSIAEIAYAIGYKNPQHFTAAFKRKFGYLPSAIR